MKRFLLSLIGALVIFSLHAQLPKWLIPATNDTIFLKLDNRLLQTIEGSKASLWTMDGEKRYTTDNTILPFRDGVATILDNTTEKLVGFVDSQGKFTALPGLSVAYDNPFYENGYLACVEDGFIVYYNREGNKVKMEPYVRAYPFHRGYAPYLSYVNVEKSKDPHFAYFKADGTSLQYSIVQNEEVKPVEPKNIDFLSGIGANGKGVGVIKDKIYWFDPETELFEPFLWGTEESEKKRHLSLAKDHGQYFLNLPSDSVVILAKYGKNQLARLKFNQELLPEQFTFEDDIMTFAMAGCNSEKYSSNLSAYGNKPYGLTYGSEKVLPEQFQEVGMVYGNRAFVKLDDKWGVIEVIPDVNYSMRLNKGEDVAFRHQKFETQIRLDLPAEISAKDVRIELPEATGCLIDKTSRETKDTESGNYVTYNCALNIPQSLPDTITTITYSPVTISYEGVVLFNSPIAIRAWHLKYYNVDPIESETSISNGVASFTINIDAQKNAGESDYPFEVRIVADSVNVDYEKLSETRYKCLVSNLQEGDNTLNIIVTEKGCPPSAFPFEIYYTKPVPKKKKKEEVVIRKKTPEARKQTQRLEI